METKGKFIFKSVTHVEGGKFTNDKNQVVEYNGYHSIKVDEINEKNEIFERKFKLSENKKSLVEKVRSFKPYEPLELTFDVVLYSSGVRLDIKDAEVIKEMK